MPCTSRRSSWRAPPIPYYAGEIDYGDRFEHCWNGDHTVSNAMSRLRYVQMFGLKWAEEVWSRAPAGADLTSWRY